MKGICGNHDGDTFEHVVDADFDDARCDGCGQRLGHESGLTWADARKKGYRSAFRLTLLPDAPPPKNRKARTHYHFAEVGKPGENAGALPFRALSGKSGLKRKRRR